MRISDWSSDVCSSDLLLPVIQSRSQLRAVYGEHVANEIVANCGVEVAFTTKELRVANELSERIGYIRQESITKSHTIHGVLANSHTSMSEPRRSIILPTELSTVERRERKEVVNRCRSEGCEGDRNSKN